MARVRGEVHFLWRLMLVPLFLAYLKLFDAFDFVFQIASVRFIDYVWNFVLLGVCFLGLVMLIAANPRRRLLAGIGMALVLSPLYLEGLQDGAYNFRTSVTGVQITNIPLNVISLAVFFSGCSLKCRFCQNFELSHHDFGKKVSIQRLRDIYLELISQGAQNIDLVNPTHYTRAILESLKDGLPVPVVWNTCG